MRITLGLKKAPAIFQHVMKVTLSTVKWQFAIVYLDGLFVFFKPILDYLSHLRPIVELFSDAGTKVMLKKGFFFEDKTGFLSHVKKPGNSCQFRKGNGWHLWNEVVPDCDIIEGVLRFLESALFVCFKFYLNRSLARQEANEKSTYF